VMADAASTAAMIEGVGSRTPRWMQTKREDFFLKEGERTGRKCMPKNIVRQNSRFQHVVSSLSSSSKSSNNDGSSGEEVNKKKSVMTRVSQNRSNGAQNVTNSSGGSNDGQPNQNGNNGTQNVRKSSGSSSDGSPNQKTSQAFHDYHAKPLPDPKLPDSGRSSTSTSEDSPEESNTSAEDTKRQAQTLPQEKIRLLPLMILVPRSVRNTGHYQLRRKQPVLQPVRLVPIPTCLRILRRKVESLTMSAQSLRKSRFYGTEMLVFHSRRLSHSRHSLD
jgi:hypothetical protein